MLKQDNFKENPDQAKKEMLNHQMKKSLNPEEFSNDCSKVLSSKDMTPLQAAML